MTSIIDAIKPYIRFRYFFLGIFLFFSCYLLVNYLTGLVNNSAIKTGVAAFAIVLDIAMQFVILSRAKRNWKTGAWKKKLWKNRAIALILFFLYAVYLIFYAVLSAVGFFMVEVEKTATEITAIEEVRINNQSRIETIDEELKALNIQLATEGKTGFGGNSRAIVERKRELEAERKAIETENRKTLTVKQEAVGAAVDSFKVLSEKLGVKQNTLETLVFGISVIMMYIFIILLVECEIGKSEIDSDQLKKEPIQPVSQPISPAQAIETKEPEPLSIRKLHFIKFVNELYRDVDESKIVENGSVELNGLLTVIQNLKGQVSQRACREYKDILNKWNAIVTDNGQKSRGLWTKDKIIEKIKMEG